MKKNFWLLLDKPSGISSAGALNKLKRILDVNKIGHNGTLDPLASGVLLVAIGEALKTISFIGPQDKEYAFSIKFGQMTDSYDGEGAIIAETANLPSQCDIESVLPEFLGIISQTTPIYSAIKIRGKPAYKYARAGEDVIMKSRLINISSLKLLNYDEISNESHFLASCSHGTYIRSLAVDIAARVGSLGYVSYLRRTRCGKYLEKDAISLEQLEKREYNHDAYCREVDDMLGDIPVHQIDDQSAQYITYGQRIDLNVNHTGKLRLYNQNKLHSIVHVETGIIDDIRIFHLHQAQ